MPVETIKAGVLCNRFRVTTPGSVEVQRAMTGGNHADS